MWDILLPAVCVPSKTNVNVYFQVPKHAFPCINHGEQWQHWESQYPGDIEVSVANMCAKLTQ